MPKLVLIAAAAAILMAGCVAPAALKTASAPESASAPSTSAAPQLIRWNGHIVRGELDMLGHDQPGESIIFPAQQAGFLTSLSQPATAIEVRVDWTTPGAKFMLHPHWLKGDDSNGKTHYYGYMSPMLDKPGCIRIPEADMAAGTWPMMVHPSGDTTNADFTITAAFVGATATVLNDLHGHRADGNYVIEDHKVEPCQILAQAQP